MISGHILMNYEFNDVNELEVTLQDITAKCRLAAGGNRGDVIQNAPGAAGRNAGTGSVGIVRHIEQRVEWMDIQDIIRKGNAPASLPVGTEINFDLKNGDPVTAVVVGLNHYSEKDAVFWIRSAIGRHCMNDDDSNEGGFADSSMRGFLNRDIFDLLPDDLQAAIAVHETKQAIDGKKNRVTEDRLFLPSEFEIAGRNDWAEYNGIDKQFPFFEERRNRVAYDEDGDPVWYWTADPSSANTTNFCSFGYSGISYYLNASTEGGVAPLFVIR